MILAVWVDEDDVVISGDEDEDDDDDTLVSFSGEPLLVSNDPPLSLKTQVFSLIYP